MLIFSCVLFVLKKVLVILQRTYIAKTRISFWVQFKHATSSPAGLWMPKLGRKIQTEYSCLDHIGTNKSISPYLKTQASRRQWHVCYAIVFFIRSRKIGFQQAVLAYEQSISTTQKSGLFNAAACPCPSVVYLADRQGTRTASHSPRSHEQITGS